MDILGSVRSASDRGEDNSVISSGSVASDVAARG
eukprot:CAMPEP_0204543426 /NCGR_PEP_ID=MMETSP0661-20131031/19750_1 /ASSEMBLY_ACC=CAM_ASM_000606 /TAXON_ID=109239 /ORGANISM="Alexandrium margalefi, Strain AMGDE01CS-322" /LENGTH=33 /DNA_ID= /DNA_START= /DNA_END= /DNA_ORIENTATION=